MSNIFKSAAKIAGTTFDYLTPGAGSNRVTDWGTGSTGKTSNVKSPSGSSTSANDNAIDKMIADLQRSLSGSNASLAALNAQMAAQPKLPKFDFSANYARAQSHAASTVNPVYEDKLNKYLQGKQLRVGQQTETTTRNKEDIQTGLSETIQDILTERGRTQEDADVSIGDITANENSFQRQEGRQFDAARTALLGDVANAGLTESGLGQGIVENAEVDRNLASEDQVREFTNAKRDTTTALTRKLSDLDTSEGRSKGTATRKTEDQDIALRNFIDNENYEEGNFRLDNELERANAITNATGSAYDQILGQTIASLAGSGARAQDIALFKQVYG